MLRETTASNKNGEKESERVRADNSGKLSIYGNESIPRTETK